MPNDNRQMGVTHQRAILYELKLINKKLEKMMEVESYDPANTLKPSIDGSMPEDSMETKRRLQQVMNMATRACCRNGCEKCEQ